MIKEEALIISNQPSFPAVAELAKRGLLSPETWQCNRPRISLKTSWKQFLSCVFLVLTIF